MNRCAGHRGQPPRAAGVLFFRLFTALALAAAGWGCAAPGGQAWTNLSRRAADYGFKPVTFKAPPFILAGLLKRGPGEVLTVYLEGDGRGMVRGRVTQDPTPSRPMGFELARSDPSPAVLYLARVGQYQPSQTGQNFQAYWSDKRLAEEAVNAAGLAIDQAKRHLGVRYIHLIGYSGGGGLALLLAERRSDVLSLVTVAGLLDTQWWVREKNFTPLVGSLNPADQAARLAELPQVHFYGSEDLIIPEAMSAHFQSLVPFAHFQRVEIKTNHWEIWPELWPNLLRSHVLPLRDQGLSPI